MGNVFDFWLNGKGYILHDKTREKIAQPTYVPRFSTGQPGVGDLSFWQFMGQDDWIGGMGQETFKNPTAFLHSHKINTLDRHKLKLANVAEIVTDQNNDPILLPGYKVTGENLYDQHLEAIYHPNIVEIAGKLYIFNYKTKRTSPGITYFTFGPRKSGTVIHNQEVTVDQKKAYVIQATAAKRFLDRDGIMTLTPYFNSSGVWNTITFQSLENAENDSNAYTLRFKTEVRLYPVVEPFNEGRLLTPLSISDPPRLVTYPVEEPYILEDKTAAGLDPHKAYKWYNEGELRSVDFLVPQSDGKNYLVELKIIREESNTAGVTTSYNEYIYFQPFPLVRDIIDYLPSEIVPALNFRDITTFQNQLAAAYSPYPLTSEFGGRVVLYDIAADGITYNDHLETSTIGIAALNIPEYMKIIGLKQDLLVALNDYLYRLDIRASGADADKWTLVGRLPAKHTVAMVKWNQRIYIASYDRETNSSFISWTDGNVEVIVDSYAIPGKFEITGMANWEGALVYVGGNSNKDGLCYGFPNTKILEIINDQGKDSVIRSINIGRYCYLGYSQGTGVIALSTTGASPVLFTPEDGLSEIGNIVWDIEEVGNIIYFIAGDKIYKSTDRYVESGHLESSWFNANSPMIEKVWAELGIELDHNLADHNFARVYYRTSESEGWKLLLSYVGDVMGVVLFTQDIIDLTTERDRLYDPTVDLQVEEYYFLDEVIKAAVKKGIQETKKRFPDNTYSKRIRLKIELYSFSGRGTPVIKELHIKYVPRALRKWAWTFAVRAENRLQLKNKNPDPRSGTGILSDLEKTWLYKDIVDFIDVDDKAYKVLITDVQEYTPLIDDTKQETIVRFELLEV